MPAVVVKGVQALSITILARDGVGGQAVAEASLSPGEIDLAGLEFAAFTGALVVFQSSGPEDAAALGVAELLTAPGGSEITGLDRPGDATGDVFIAVDVPADAPAAMAFDPILVIADDSQAEIDIAAIV